MAAEFWAIGIDVDRCAELGIKPNIYLENERWATHVRLGITSADLFQRQIPLYRHFATAERVARAIMEKTGWPLAITDDRGRSVTVRIGKKKALQ